MRKKKNCTNVTLESLSWLVCENCLLDRLLVFSPKRKRSRKEKERKHLLFQLSKNSRCHFLQYRKWVDCAWGSRRVLMSLLPRPLTRCVNMIAFLRLSKERCAYKLIIQPSFFPPADLLSYLLSKYLSATVVTRAALLQELWLFPKTWSLWRVNKYWTVKRLKVK